MSRMTQLLLVAVVSAASTAASQRPDFSGEWALVVEAPTPAPQGGGSASGRAVRAGDMGSGWGSPMTVVQDAGRLTVQDAFFVRGDLQPPLKFVYALDGAETRNSVMMGRGIQEQRAKAAWDGERLVITTLHAFESPQNGEKMTAEVRQVLSLDSPSSLVVETTRVGVLGGPTGNTRSVYSRR